MEDQKKKSRQNLRRIWENSNEDDLVLEGEERILAEIMHIHPEYHELWAQLDEVTDEELEKDGSNPVLHIMSHQIVENQVADQNPPETAETLNKLMQQGMTRHEAVHEIGRIVSEAIFIGLKQGQTFNEQRYAQKLRQLVRPQRRRKRRRKT